MLVALGTTLFTIAPLESGLQNFEVGRVIQGIAAGIGFIGAGTILKRAEEEQVTGLTTAANIWLTAAVGVAVGLGRLWLPIFTTLVAVTVLIVVGYLERGLTAKDE
jgi:putative Mg2+ transporter-C (MgtC) family protein